MSPSGIAVVRVRHMTSSSDNSGESHAAQSPDSSNIVRQAELCTGMQPRISAKAPRSRASTSSDTLPTATGIPSRTHRSKRSWSSSRHTSSRSGTTSAGQSPSCSASAVAYNRVAPASSAAHALDASATSAHTSAAAARGATEESVPLTADSNWLSCPIRGTLGSEREAYGTRSASSSAAHASARSLCTAENAMPHPSSSSTSNETASKGDPPMRPT